MIIIKNNGREIKYKRKTKKNSSKYLQREKKSANDKKTGGYGWLLVQSNSSGDYISK